MAWNDPHPIVASPLTAPFLVSCRVILKSKHVKVEKEHNFPSNGFAFQSYPKITPHGTFSETCVCDFSDFSFLTSFSVGKSKTFMEFLLQHVYCQQKWGPPRLKMRAICIDTPIIGFDNVKPCVTFTTSMAAFFTLQHVRSNKILQKMLLWCQKWILQESRCTSNYLLHK